MEGTGIHEGPAEETLQEGGEAVSSPEMPPVRQTKDIGGDASEITVSERAASSPGVLPQQTKKFGEKLGQTLASTFPNRKLTHEEKMAILDDIKRRHGIDGPTLDAPARQELLRKTVGFYSLWGRKS